MEKQEKNDKESENEADVSYENNADTQKNNIVNDVELLKQNSRLTTENQSLQDKLLRQLAESENIRTRLSKRIDDTKDYAISNFVKDLVSVMDNFSRILEHLPKNLSEDLKVVVEGVKMTQQDLASVFEKHSVTPIYPKIGDPFHHNVHDAISELKTEDHEENTIVDIVQVGYKLKNRLIRPASVVVAKNTSDI